MYIYRNNKTKEQIEVEEPEKDLEENEDWELLVAYNDTQLNPKKIYKKCQTKN